MKAELIRIFEEETGIECTDSKTGLLNQTFFEIAVSRDFERSERYGEPLSFALIDVDSTSHFKEDTDPEKANLILREICGLIMKNIREVDIAAKFTDGLLGVMLVRANRKIALNTLERIRSAVEERTGGRATVSGGLASFPRDATTMPTLTANAHNALDRAKKKGNVVIPYSKIPLTYTEPQSKILVVDDDLKNVKLLEILLKQSNYKVVTAFNGEDALSVLNTSEIDLVLLDVMMPKMDGFQVCRRIKTNDGIRLIPVVLITALDCLDDKVKGIDAGADDFLTKPVNLVELNARVKSLLKLRTFSRNLASMEGLLFSLANAVEAKDNYTQGHTQRVSNLAVTLGRKLGLSTGECQALKYGGALHDVGKIGIPSKIINKPGKLDPEEWVILKRHPDIGYKICMPLKNSLGPALDAIRYHHEKLNGKGYPQGLTHESIPIIARIMAIVDIFDSLTTDRPYRKAMPYDDAFEILSKEAEKGELDKSILKTFKTIFD